MTFISKFELRSFENDIERLFEASAIKAPVHFAGGNEDELIKIFKDIRTYDWVLCSWRSHYHCLLRGVPPRQVKEAIIRGRSIGLCFPKYKILSSAIVGGICPIAVGLAWAIKERKGRERVWCFIGDMTERTGIYHECFNYCIGHSLPVTFVVEDNGLSVMTDTLKAWGSDLRENINSTSIEICDHVRFYHYKYKMTRPHVGTGKWVSF